MLSALALAVSDIYLSTIYPSTTAPNPPHLTPQGIYWLSQTLRPLCLALHDLLASGLIYVTLTNRLPFPPPLGGATSLNSASDAESKHNQLRALTQSTLALQTALTKLRAYTVARSAVVRDPGLKGREDGYWRVVVGMEGPSREARPRAREGVDDGMGDGGGESGSIWEEEEVMQAMADVTMRRMGGGGGGVDVERVRREAEAFVEGVLAGLDLDVEDERQEEVR